MENQTTGLAPSEVATGDGAQSGSDLARGALDRALTIDLEQVTRDLVEVEAALERLDDGTYGRCRACSSAIDDESLASDPTQSTCTQHLPV